jgi:HAD superfamily hydrolase (TIGR01509 family)
MRKIKALIFDFDGLILETESQIFQSWQTLYKKLGCQLPFDRWALLIGAAENDIAFDPLKELEFQLGDKLENQQQILSERHEFESQLILRQEILPGVCDYLENAKRLKLKLGLASSSPKKWVIEHLTRLELINYFECIRTADDVKYAKPDPSLYLETMACLSIKPEQGIAFEDSPNGLIAAKKAGLFTVVVPNDLTRNLPLDQADLRLNSLEDLKLHHLLEKVESNSR